MEAEYVAMSLCTREALRIRKILKDFNIPVPKTGLGINADNEMATSFAIEKKQTAKSKHIDVCYNLTQDYISKKWVQVTYLSGKENHLLQLLKDKTTLVRSTILLFSSEIELGIVGFS